MYDMLRAELAQNYERHVADVIAYIDNTKNDITRFLTPAKKRKYESGKMTEAEAVANAKTKALKDRKKSYEQSLKKIEKIENLTSEVDYFSVVYEFTRSGTCHADVEVSMKNGIRVMHKGTASGWGYDKASASVAEALNQYPEMLKLLYDHKEASLRSGIKSAWSNENCIAYGAGYGALPYYEGGVGMSTVEYLFKVLGFKTRLRRYVDNGPTFLFMERE